MADRLACKLCIAEKGLQGSEIDQLPRTDEEMAIDLQEAHGIEVMPDPAGSPAGFGAAYLRILRDPRRHLIRLPPLVAYMLSEALEHAGRHPGLAQDRSTFRHVRQMHGRLRAGLGPLDPGRPEGDSPSAAFREALARLLQETQPLALEASAAELWSLIGVLQLLSRHPEFSALASGRLLLDVARQLQALFRSKGPDPGPLWETIEMGWDPAHDHEEVINAYSPAALRLFPLLSAPLDRDRILVLTGMLAAIDAPMVRAALEGLDTARRDLALHQSLPGAVLLLHQLARLLQQMRELADEALPQDSKAHYNALRDIGDELRGLFDGGTGG